MGFCMALSTLYFYMRAQAVSGSKFFEVLTMGITGIATLAYLLMFTGAGRMWVEEVPGTFSPVYWGRYVDWVLTTPSHALGYLGSCWSPIGRDRYGRHHGYAYDWFRMRRSSNPRPKQVVFLHLRNGHFHPHLRCIIEVQQGQQVRRRSTCSLQQSRMDDHYLMDPLPSRLDCC